MIDIKKMKDKLGLFRDPRGSKYTRFPNYQEPKGKLPKNKTGLTAVGFTSGVGSMLIGARQAGFQVLGNVEWRDYYRMVDDEGRNTFIENFPGAFFARGLADLGEDEVESIRGATIALGHPECGSYSLLNSANKNAREQKKDAGDIPLFIDYVRTLRPKYFVMDDLPQSFIAFPMSEYHDMLPEYDLFPEWISNYNYGNPQKFRRRMFMIGSLKSEKYTFEPGEREEWDNWTVQARIEDIEGLYGSMPNHDEHTTKGYSSRFINMRKRGDRPSWGEVQKYFKKHQKPGQNFVYHGPNGPKVRPSLIRMKYDYPSPVLTGGNPMMHPNICLPLSVRERARIQGFPDDFIFYGTRFDEDGKWEHNNHNMWMVKQTGKAMPIEFNDYAARHIAAHVLGKPSPATHQRFLKPDPHISNAKEWFCENVGYSDQKSACSSCWLFQTCNLPCKVGGARVPLDVEGFMK